MKDKKHLVNGCSVQDRGESSMARLVYADRKAVVTEIILLQPCCTKKHLRTHNTLILEVDRLQWLNTTEIIFV